MADNIKEKTYTEAVLELATIGEKIAAKAQEARDIISSLQADLKRLFPLCENCGERPPMKDTPYCEVCRDEMEDFFNEMGKDDGQHDKYNER